MKHSIITRINFLDLSLMSEYLKITKEILIPALKSQTVQNFELVIITNESNFAILKEELDYPFKPVFGNNACYSHLIGSGVNIQTRHDCDDYMSPTYVEKIQSIYYTEIKRHNSFLIQAQPTKLIYGTGEEYGLRAYSNKRCSMFLSLCQTKVTRHIFERTHGQMHEVANHVLTIPTGYTKWIIHGKNKTVLRKK